MASIFLSYSHEDAKRAQRLIQALQDAGHRVWYDQHIHAGRRFSKDIDQALKVADMVVVLWSKASVESAWVQDEAAHGRDRGRLVPVLIDKIDPPLGFRQYQAISMRGGNTASVVQAVDALLSTGTSQEQAVAKPPKVDRRSLLVVAAILLVVSSAGGWWFYRQSGAGQPSLSIVAAEGPNSPLADKISEELVDSIRRFKAGPISTLEIMPSGGKGGGIYDAKVTYAGDERQVSINLVLDHRRDGRLWSFALSGAPHSQADMVLETAGRLGNVLACDLDLRKRKYDVTSEVRALYLKGCSRMGDLSQERDEQAISAFRQATQKAPKFAPAWAHLSYAYFAAIDSAPPGRRSEVAWTAGGYHDMAKRLDPSLPEPYYVEAFNGPSYPGKMAEALGIIDEGLRRNDGSALLFDARAQILANLGLLREALDSSKRAIDLEPLSPTYLGNYVRMLAYTGQMDAARKELDDARRSWPRSPSIAIIQYYFDLRYGDPRRALSIIRSGDMGPSNSDEGTQLYLQARISPTPANVEAVLGYYRLQFEKDPEDTFRYVQALGTFGRFNDAYAVLLGKPEAVENFTRDGEGLFRPYMRPMLNDPRFIDVAFRTGMLTFWRKSGQWPDFCSDPKLPYDCKNEAAKFPLEPPKANI